MYDISVTEDELHGGLERDFFPPQIEELAEIHPKFRRISKGRANPMGTFGICSHNLADG
jgi:hypothetical protein